MKNRVWIPTMLILTLKITPCKLNTRAMDSSIAHTNQCLKDLNFRSAATQNRLRILTPRWCTVWLETKGILIWFKDEFSKLRKTSCPNPQLTVEGITMGLWWSQFMITSMKMSPIKLRIGSTPKWKLLRIDWGVNTKSILKPEASYAFIVWTTMLETVIRKLASNVVDWVI